MQTAYHLAQISMNKRVPIKSPGSTHEGVKLRTIFLQPWLSFESSLVETLLGWLAGVTAVSGLSIIALVAKMARTRK
jgi:hypothetical protein